MKFWMVAMSTILFSLMTGCPDGDDCTSDPSLCDSDTDSDSGADADADADSDATEDDGDTSEAVNCPSVAGDWALTYRNSLGYEGNYTLTLEQDGCLVTGYDNDCDYTGTISESGYISLFRDCPSIDRTVTGNLTTPPPHMDGSWDDTDGPHGTWWADPQ